MRDKLEQLLKDWQEEVENNQSVWNKLRFKFTDEAKRLEETTFRLRLCIEQVKIVLKESV